MDVDFCTASYDTHLMEPHVIWSDLYETREAMMRFQALVTRDNPCTAFDDPMTLGAWLEERWETAISQTYGFKEDDKYTMYYMKGKAGHCHYEIADVVKEPIDVSVRNVDGLTWYRCCCDECNKHYFAAYLRVPHEPYDGSTSAAFASRRRIHSGYHSFSNVFCTIAKVTLTDDSGTYYIIRHDPRVLCIKQPTVYCQFDELDDLQPME